MAAATPPRSGLQYWLPLVLWVAAILGASSIPGTTLARVGFSVKDSLAHGVEYGVLGFLIARGEIMVRGRRAVTAWGSAAVGAALLGALDESYQHLIPGRFPSVSDWVADAVGAALGAGIALVVYIPAKRRLERSGNPAAAGREEEA